MWLQTTTMVLHLAPASMARVFPEVDEALLKVSVAGVGTRVALHGVVVVGLDSETRRSVYDVPSVGYTEAFFVTHAS